MQLYKTTYLSTDELNLDGTKVPYAQWHGSADAASKGRTALKQTDRHCDPKTEPVDVPMSKAALLTFLTALTDQKKG
jgi:hypothetical protein